MSLPISRRAYADIYGPTTGNRVRLHLPAGTAVLEPGERIVYGGNGLIDGKPPLARSSRRWRRF